jgi:hypothetical protein
MNETDDDCLHEDVYARKLSNVPVCGREKVLCQAVDSEAVPDIKYRREIR